MAEGATLAFITRSLLVKVAFGLLFALLSRSSTSASNDLGDSPVQIFAVSVHLANLDVTIGNLEQRFGVVIWVDRHSIVHEGSLDVYIRDLVL